MRALPPPETTQDPAASARYLPLVLVATFAVVALPLLLVVWLRGSGVLMTAWAGVLVGVAGSLAASWIGAALWKRTAHSGDVLFSDLMLWGWLHRARSARRVEAATELLAARGGQSHAISGRRLSNEQKASLLAGLIADLESRDPYTNGHSRRVARYAADIARQMGLDRPAVAKIRAAGAVHDVGKIYTPTKILHKQGKLSGEEFAVIERHALDGTEMVSALGDPELTAMVRHHHERMDGGGYPDRVSGEEIPLGARILAVADTFDAITSTRPYRRAHTHEEALRILAEGAGIQHDPSAVRAFERCYSGRRTLAIWAFLANGLSRTTPAFGAGTGSAGGAAAVGAGVAGVGTTGAWIAAATVAAGGIAIAAGVGATGDSGGGQIAAEQAAGAPAPAVAASGSATSSPTPTVRPAGRAPTVASRSGRSAPTGPNTVALRLSAAVAAARTPRAGTPRKTGSQVGGFASPPTSSAVPTAVAPTAVAPTAVAPAAGAPTAVAPAAVAPTAVAPTPAVVPAPAASPKATSSGEDDEAKKAEAKKPKAEKAKKRKAERAKKRKGERAKEPKAEKAKEPKAEKTQEPKAEKTQEPKMDKEAGGAKKEKGAEKDGGRAGDPDVQEPKAQKPPVE